MAKNLVDDESYEFVEGDELSFSPDTAFEVVTVHDDTGYVIRNAIPCGLYIARLYDQRQNPVSIVNTSILYYDGVHNCRSAVIDFNVYGVGGVTVYIGISALGASIQRTDNENAPAYYTLELHQIGTTA